MKQNVKRQEAAGWWPLVFSANGLMMLFRVLIICALLVGCDEPGRYPSRTLPAGLSGSVAAVNAGMIIFAEKCASCHGHPDEGRSARADFFFPSAPVFSERKYRDVDPAYLYWRIETGKNAEPYKSMGSVMPAWGQHLSETEVWQLVVYLKTRAENTGG